MQILHILKQIVGYGLGYVYKQPELTTTSFKCRGGENYNGK